MDGQGVGQLLVLSVLKLGQFVGLALLCWSKWRFLLFYCLNLNGMSIIPISVNINTTIFDFMSICRLFLFYYKNIINIYMSVLKNVSKFK